METVNLTPSITLSTSRREPAAPVLALASEASNLSVSGLASETKASSRENAASAVEKFKALVHDLQRNLDFSVDDSSGQVVVKVMDGESGELIRQIPSEDLLRLSERLEDMRSLLFKAEA